MRAERIARWAGISAAVAALFLLFCYLSFPTTSIDNLLAEVLLRQGLRLAPTVHKTLLPALAWDKPHLSSEQGLLLGGERLQIRLQLLPLLFGRAAVSASATIGTGNLEISYSANGKNALELSADGINLADIAFFKTVLGAKAAGTLWSRGTLTRGPQGLAGDLKLELKQLEFSGVKLGAFPLPDVTNLKTQGMIRVGKGKTRLESFTLEGNGIFMRLSGDLPTGANAAVTPLNLSLEILPKPDFLEKQKLVFMMLIKFMTAPGIYTVPIRGTLLKPEIL